MFDDETMIQQTNIDIDAVIEAYVDCALWSTNADHLDPEGTGAAGSLQYIGAELAPETRIAMREDVVNFVTSASPSAIQFWGDHHGDEAIGHDFWLTRNRHGAGFWDRWSGSTEGARFGRVLTDACKPMGEVDLYVGDDGLVYAS